VWGAAAAAGRTAAGALGRVATLVPALLAGAKRIVFISGVVVSSRVLGVPSVPSSSAGSREPAVRAWAAIRLRYCCSLYFALCRAGLLGIQISF
jgi:hypothetical protein